MQVPATPPDEAMRVDTLRKMLILDTPPEARFDNLTRVAAAFFRVKIAVISLVDTDRQWFKSACGLHVKETSRDISFCGHTILQDQVLVVKDALLDKRFFDNPLVTGEPKIRFYAGAPLKMSNGAVIGTLCLIDPAPHQLQDYEVEMLSDMAVLVVQELEKSMLNRNISL
jgi:GAF domain-containing protein